LEDEEGRLNFKVHLPPVNHALPECANMSLKVVIDHGNGRLYFPLTSDVSLKEWECGNTIKVRIFCMEGNEYRAQCAEFCVVGGDCGMCASGGSGGGFCEPAAPKISVKPPR
jgi:hypothetical protein